MFITHTLPIFMLKLQLLSNDLIKLFFCFPSRKSSNSGDLLNVF